MSKFRIFLFWSVPSISQVKEYKIKSDLLKKAIFQLNPVKVIAHKNEAVNFKKIEMESGTFYGLKKIKGKINKILLNVNSIKTVILLQTKYKMNL